MISVNISTEKGKRKSPVAKGFLKENFGLEGDAHASSKWHRQVSLLGTESINRAREKGFHDVNWGDFAENITTEGIDLVSLPIGAKLRIGEAIAEVTQIGKHCHTKCEIFTRTGDCIMPKEGIFVRVLKGGTVQAGDEVLIL